MKTEVFPCTCSICGGDGVGNSKTVAASWYGGNVRHTNPQVCADNLRRKAEELKKLELKLKSAQ